MIKQALSSIAFGMYFAIFAPIILLVAIIYGDWHYADNEYEDAEYYGFTNISGGKHG